MTLLDWYNSDPYTKDEIDFLLSKQKAREENPNLERFNVLKVSFDFKSLDNYDLQLDTCARDLIKKLFNKYTDDNTLVITTGIEHRSVNELLKNVKHHFIIDEYRLLHSEVIEHELSRQLKSYKKVFIYLLGVHMDTGLIIDNNIYDSIIKVIPDNYEVISVLDDVHGLFAFPRLRHQFDYVIATAHAILDGFNFGMLFSKSGVQEFGFKSCNLLEDLSRRYEILKTRFNKFYKLRDIIGLQYPNYISLQKQKYVGNIIAYKLKPDITIEQAEKYLYGNTEHKYDKVLRFCGDKQPYFRLRSQELIFLSEKEIEEVNQLIKRSMSLVEE